MRTKFGIGVAWVAALVLLYVPVLNALALSFNSAKRGWQWEGFTTRWYAVAWNDSVIRAATANTAIVGMLAVGISVSVGGAAAYEIMKLTKATQARAITLALLAVLVPDFLFAITHAVLYSALSVPKGVLTIAISQSLVGTAFVVLFALVAMRSVDLGHLARAARAFGASDRQIRRRIFLPLARPALMVSAGFVAVYSAQDFLFAFFVGGPGSTTLAVHLQSQIRFGSTGVTNVAYSALVLSSCALATLLHRTNLRGDTQ
jgi:spermidine/putrescine transport system permease protein